MVLQIVKLGLFWVGSAKKTAEAGLSILMLCGKAKGKNRTFILVTTTRQCVVPPRIAHLMKIAGDLHAFSVKENIMIPI
ncbi:hypothetical protein J3D56_004235 [Erwinia persicina]|uniref:hypothetical protein n=1 Tax=Erwinia persicina TaxID=55211 RepID=UPI00209C94E8|nr:hypothetical protein [Erwinia persicina]MCP1440799.1 hypothetical protein [Erwinia persicina]